MAGLRVTVAGAPLDHLLYHFCLPWSGFEHAHVILGGESFVARSPPACRARCARSAAACASIAATVLASFRNLALDARNDLTERYGASCAHYGMTPGRNNRAAHENGAIESAHGHLKSDPRATLD